MTKFFKLMEARMQDPEFNRKFTKAVQVDQKLIEQNREAYNRVKERFPTLPYEDKYI